MSFEKNLTTREKKSDTIENICEDFYKTKKKT